MKFFYPQCLVRIHAIIQLSRTQDETTSATFFARPLSISITRNSFNEADECSMEFDSSQFPILPRLIRQCLVQVYAGDATNIDSKYLEIGADKYLKFIGYIDDPELDLDENSGKVTWKARDYTALFLEAKRANPKLGPLYSDRLDAALRRIIDALPGGTNIGLELVGLDSWPMLSSAVSASQKNVKVPIKPEDTLWDFIKRACDPVALIPQIKLDKLVVSTSRGINNPNKRPVFIYGYNLTKFKEKRNLVRIREGIGLNGYDLSQRKYITSVWPPEGDRAIVKHLKQAVGTKGKPKPGPPIPGTNDKRKWFPFGPVANKKTLDEAAKRIFETRQRQEFEGSFTCQAMQVPMDNGREDYDVTQLANGDRIMVDVLPDQRSLLGGLKNTSDRLKYLVSQGYESGLASLLVKSFDAGVNSPLEVYVRRATHKFEESSGYTLEVDFQNLIAATGV